MFNQFVYNSQVYNKPDNLFSLSDQDSIIFNGYSLQNAQILTSKLLEDSAPDRSLSINDVPRGDGQFFTGDYWRQKRIPIGGILKRPTAELLEKEIDLMKKKLAVREGILDITRPDGIIRRYRATLNNGGNIFAGRQHWHVTFIPYDLEFISLEPFGHSVNYEHVGLYDQTDLTLNEQINNKGTITAKPIIILNFEEADGITAISFRNNDLGQEIKLTKNIVAGDYVRFDSDTMEVTVNSVVQDYSGSFPLLKTDSNSVTITITGTSAKYIYTAKYLIPYL